MGKSVSLYEYRHVMRTFWAKRFSYKQVIWHKSIEIMRRLRD